MALFWRKENKKPNNKILQITLNSDIPVQHLSNITSEKKASSPVFSGCRGSLAVEASLAFPLFLFFFLNILSILQLLSCYSRIEAALHQTARKWALYACVEDGEPGAGAWLGAALLPREIEKQLGEEAMAHLPIRGGKTGLQCYLSALPDEREVMDLVVCYRAVPLFPLPGFSEFTMVNRCRVRCWTGYETPPDESGESGAEEIVYITETGVVYHKSRTCSHLKLSVRTIGSGALEAARNADGGRYYPCEKCGAESGRSLYYIADEGEKYHTSPGCSGLIRKVMAVPLSQTGGMRACSRCY